MPVPFQLGSRPCLKDRLRLGPSSLLGERLGDLERRYSDLPPGDRERGWRDACLLLGDGERGWRDACLLLGDGERGWRDACLLLGDGERGWRDACLLLGDIQYDIILDILNITMFDSTCYIMEKSDGPGAPAAMELWSMVCSPASAAVAPALLRRGSRWKRHAQAETIFSSSPSIARVRCMSVVYVLEAQRAVFGGKGYFWRNCRLTLLMHGLSPYRQPGPEGPREPWPVPTMHRCRQQAGAVAGNGQRGGADIERHSHADKGSRRCVMGIINE